MTDNRIENLRKLPSLGPLIGFEATARLLSTTKAAKELSLSQSAISRQVKTLEAQLGTKLFKREARSLHLTHDGDALLRVATEMLGRLSAVCTSLKDTQVVSRRVTVSVDADFASQWLLPRLAAFREIRPELDVVISVAHPFARDRRENIDFALRRVSTSCMSPKNSTLLFGNDTENIFLVPFFDELRPEAELLAAFVANEGKKI